MSLSSRVHLWTMFSFVTLEYKEAFSLYDKAGEGCIDSKELGTVMRALGQNPSLADIEGMKMDLESDSKYIHASKQIFNSIHRGSQHHVRFLTLKSWGHFLSCCWCKQCHKDNNFLSLTNSKYGNVCVSTFSVLTSFPGMV